MKHRIMTVGLLVASSALFALDCGNLGITIVNASQHQCVLKHVHSVDGYFQNQAPLTIPSNTTSPTFYLAQDAYGIDVELDYRCDDKVVVINSTQAHCGLMAGYVMGYAYSGNDLVTEHQETIGSYWSAIPGQITWTIH